MPQQTYKILKGRFYYLYFSCRESERTKTKKCLFLIITKFSKKPKTGGLARVGILLIRPPLFYSPQYKNFGCIFL